MSDDAEDAVALAVQLAKSGAREDVVRAQAELVLWAFEHAPAMVKAWPPQGPWDAAVLAVRQVAAGDTPDTAVLGQFFRWIAAQSTDWATREALDQLYYGVERVLGPFTGGHPDPDVESTVDELVRAAGLWAWDELLSEASEYGDPGGEQAAQEAVRERDERVAHVALAGILRRCIRV
jgi:hypothetical protein